MRSARELVDGVHGEHTYGVNTGFGRFVSAHIPEELAEELQLRLLRSHACGVGEPYPDEVVRAAMLLRANALAKGFSGARVGDGRASARMPQPRRPAAGAGARVRRRERRPRTAGAPRTPARRGGTRDGRRQASRTAAMRSAKSASIRSGWRAKRGSRSSTGRSSWRRWPRSASSALGASLRPRISHAPSRSRRSRAHGRASSRRSIARDR